MASKLLPAFAARAQRAYQHLNDSPWQRRFRRECPHLVGAVYWNPQPVPVAQLRFEFRRIKAAGFSFVRFHAIGPFEKPDGSLDFTLVDEWMKHARAAGLQVFLHWAVRDTTPATRARARAVAEHFRGRSNVVCWLLGGEPHASGIPLLSDEDKQAFLAWLKQQYGAPAAVHRAWSIYPRRQPKFVGSWADALRIACTIKKGEGLVLATTEAKHEVYGAARDLMRFRADQMVAHHREVATMIRRVDKTRPIWVGNHQLFLNEAQLGWDVMESGRTADAYYTSIHLSWHFEPSEGEVDRPVYMQSRFTHDAFKGGLTSAYETTGGPVQYSGGYGNHMDAGLMRRLMFSYLAAGNQSIAFWDWVCRPGGIEVGEYGLVTLSGKVSEWAREAGRVSRAMQRYRREIWHAAEEPELGILRSWDTQAILALEPRRFDTEDGLSDFSRGPSQQHMRALIGASRAAINHHIAFEYVTEQELRAGIAGVYPTIYLPHVRACSTELLEVLLDYVRNGGRLVGDVQLGFLDPWGKLHPRGKGTLLAQLFGAWVDSIHDARTNAQSVDDLAVPGFYGDIELAGARVLKRFADGRPAVTEASIGRGQAVLIGFDPARQCWRPGQSGLEMLLADLYRGDAPARWWSDAPLVFRRSHAKADHWFFLNDGPARQATLRVYDRQYRSGWDAVTGERLDVAGTIVVPLPARSGMWVRLEK